MAVVTMAVMPMAGELLGGGADWGPGDGWWVIFPLLWLLLVGGVIFALVRGRRSWGRGQQGQSAADVLAERYARGEIAEEEYRERLNVLKGPQ